VCVVEATSRACFCCVQMVTHRSCSTPKKGSLHSCSLSSSLFCETLFPIYPPSISSTSRHSLQVEIAWVRFGATTPPRLGQASSPFAGSLVSPPTSPLCSHPAASPHRSPLRQLSTRPPFGLSHVHENEREALRWSVLLCGSLGPARDPGPAWRGHDTYCPQGSRAPRPRDGLTGGGR